MDHDIFEEFEDIPKNMIWLTEHFDELSPLEMLMFAQAYMGLGTILNEIYQRHAGKSDNKNDHDNQNDHNDYNDCNANPEGEKMWEDIKYIFKWKGENEDDQRR